MHRYRQFIFSDHDLLLLSKEANHNATPVAELHFGYVDSRRETQSVTLTGLDAARFIRWSDDVFTRATGGHADGNLAYVSGPLPEEVREHVSDQLWFAVREMPVAHGAEVTELALSA